MIEAIVYKKNTIRVVKFIGKNEGILFNSKDVHKALGLTLNSTYSYSMDFPSVTELAIRSNEEELFERLSTMFSNEQLKETQLHPKTDEDWSDLK
ncbi:hypothetical protein AB6C57_23935 [Vibrio splendidus]